MLRLLWNGNANWPQSRAGKRHQIEVVKRMLDLSFEATGGRPAEMALLLRQETERWGKVVRITGARAD